MHFDLLSDLHENWWPVDQRINYAGLGTSLLAVVAGDISQDWNYTHDYLADMARHYRHVIFVDGNHEHNGANNIQANCDQFLDRIKNLDNVTYLHKSAIILDDTAFIGCNGWWTYDFCEPEMSKQDCWLELLLQTNDEYKMSENLHVAREEYRYLVQQLQIFDADFRINNIVIVTHTAPLKRFRYIPASMSEANMGRAGNSFMANALRYNTNKKIRAWCFGHVHKQWDETIDGIRYVCNPRGRPGDDLSQVYYPKLIEV
jgi:predicted phosphodiesterase